MKNERRTVLIVDDSTTISEWFGALNDSQPYYVAVVDEDGRLTFTNSNFYLNFQASRTAPIPDGFFDLVHDDDRQQLNEVLSSLARYDRPVTAETRLKNSQGRWIKWEISSLRMPETRSEKYLFLGQDITESHNLSGSMVTSDLKAGGLVASIRELVEDLRYTKLFTIGFIHSSLWDIESMSQNKKITLFRIVQEQIMNIISYSNAKNIEISLFLTSSQIRLEIKDDGIGFDPQNASKGLGIPNISEQTRLYNGKVVLTTAPGKGCSIIINIPLEASYNPFPIRPRPEGN